MRAVVVADGEPRASDAGLLSSADLVVAADGGAAWTRACGRVPDLLVGDLDSADADLVRQLEGEGTVVERHPADKDESDAELAVARAFAAGADEVVLLGALGGRRLDHAVANLLLLADREWQGRLGIVHGGARVRALRGPGRRQLDCRAGDLVSLLPLGSDADGVTTEGLRYPLDGEPLQTGRARGLSNVAERDGPSVSVERGTLLVIETSMEGGAE